MKKNTFNKKLSLAEFQALVSRPDWHRRQVLEVIERLLIQVEEWDEKNQTLLQFEVPHVYGSASKTSSLDGLSITYTEGFDFYENDHHSLSTGSEGLDETWSIDGAVVVDDEGNELHAHELEEYLDADFSCIDYSELEIKKVTEIDMEEDSEMDTFTLEIDNAPSLRFTGELIARVASSDNKATGKSFSGQAGRWTELYLYKTKSGKYICHQIGRTRWISERDRYSGKVCESLEDVKEFFGHRWLAKELYAEAGIDDAVDID